MRLPYIRGWNRKIPLASPLQYLLQSTRTYAHSQYQYDARRNLVFAQGKILLFGQRGSEALGRKPHSTDLRERHPFDVEILRIHPCKSAYPYHSHSAQWEFYHVISGRGTVRHKDGTTPMVAGDAFIFQPGEPHQLTSDASQELVVYVVADNPIGESGYYPDSNKWIVRSPERRIIRSEPLDYYDGEE